MFSKVYGEVRALVRVWVLLLCDGKGEIEFQGYGEAWVTTMVMVRCLVQGPGLGLGVH